LDRRGDRINRHLDRRGAQRHHSAGHRRARGRR
jgi:hypothetical protein